MFRASHRTTTIFWPLSNCLATVLASRPRRWPLPSIVIYYFPSSAIMFLNPLATLPRFFAMLSYLFCWLMDERRLTTGSKVDILSCYTWVWEDKYRKALPVSSTFVMVEDCCWFVVELVVVDFFEVRRAIIVSKCLARVFSRRAASGLTPTALIWKIAWMRVDMLSN